MQRLALPQLAEVAVNRKEEEQGKKVCDQPIFERTGSRKQWLCNETNRKGREEKRKRRVGENKQQEQKVQIEWQQRETRTDNV